MRVSELKQSDKRGGFVARQYLRVSKSKNKSRPAKSPEQQSDDNREAFEREGFTEDPRPPYTDVGRSASRYARVKRESFDTLIADLENDTFGADILAMWEFSRGSRKVYEWAYLIELCEKRKVKIWVTTHGRLLNPANARDRKAMHDDASDVEYESDKISERILRDVRDAAHRGRPHGKNIYGYRRVYDPVSRQLMRVEEHPEQAPVVREAAELVLKGESLYAIAKSFNERNIPPRRPTMQAHRENYGWTPPAVKQMLTMPAYAGKRQHQGEIVGDAIWPALIEESVWIKLQSVLSPESRRRTNHWPAAHLLSGIAFCDVCGGPLRVGRQNAGRRVPGGEPPARYFTYICAGVPGRPGPNGKRGFHVAMKEEHLDEIVVALLVARVYRKDFLATIGQDDAAADRDRLELIREIDSMQSYLAAVRERAAEEMRPDLMFDQETRLAPKIAAAQAKLEALTGMDPFVVKLIKSGTLETEWPTLDIADRRRVISAVLAPRVKRIDPATRGQRGKNHERVIPGWR